MIKQDIVCDTLEEYYDQLKQVQERAHGVEYTLVHEELKKLLQQCNSYVEFGVMQGPTLAVACLSGIKHIRGFDIKLKWYNKASHLFTGYAQDHGIDFQVKCESSLTCSFPSVDLLYIDSLHTYAHLSKELQRHGRNVNKFITMHDTTARPELERAITGFLIENKQWERINTCSQSVGFTTIGRTSQ